MPRKRYGTVGPSCPIVVNCPSFDENNGGAIVLHYLVDRLRAQGVEAYAWPIFREKDYYRAHLANIPKWKRALKILNQERKNRRKEQLNVLNFATHPSMDVPIAPKRVLRRAIAVYPEIISGNPLGARHVSRWLLHRPTFFGDGLEFNSNEMYFYYQKAFKDGLPWIDPDNMLRVRWVRDDIYYDRKTESRSGSCRMVRKGKKTGVSEIPKGDDAILLDNKTHSEIAYTFNVTKRFYCHDPYTMYTWYAAVCGCIPIVLRQPGLSIEDWRPLERRWGIAYGDSDDQITWAIETRYKLLEVFDKERKDEEEMVRSFIQKLASRFS